MQIAKVKKVMRDKKIVKWSQDNTDYIVTACILRISSNRWYYQLELKYPGRNEVRIVDMADVEIKEEI